MKVSDFSVIVAQREGKKKQVSIAQIKEILKIINDLLGGDVYKSIKVLKSGKKKMTLWERIIEWVKKTLKLLTGGVRDAEFKP